jgi:hypothetical protein
MSKLAQIYQLSISFMILPAVTESSSPIAFIAIVSICRRSSRSCSLPTDPTCTPKNAPTNVPLTLLKTPTIATISADVRIWATTTKRQLTLQTTQGRSQRGRKHSMSAYFKFRLCAFVRRSASIYTLIRFCRTIGPFSINADVDF